MYYDPEVGLFRYIRHDLDLSFGLFDNLRILEVATRDVLTWYDNNNPNWPESRGYRLPKRLLEQPLYRDRFIELVNILMDSFMTLEESSSLKDRWRGVVRQLTKPVLQDSWHLLDYFWSFDHFLHAVRDRTIGVGRDALSTRSTKH